MTYTSQDRAESLPYFPGDGSRDFDNDGLATICSSPAAKSTRMSIECPKRQVPLNLSLLAVNKAISTFDEISGAEGHDGGMQSARPGGSLGTSQTTGQLDTVILNGGAPPSLS